MRCVPQTSSALDDLTATVARRLDLAAAWSACLLVLVALVIIWVARLSIGRDVYISVMGAPGMPTATWFQVALVLVAVSGGLVAFAARGIRVSPPILRLWRPAVSLACAGGFFLIASQVTCTPGCPLPYGPLFTWPDFTHTTSAVLAFALACWAMLQLSFAPGQRVMAAFSLGCGIAVALVAATGGIMSLAGWEIGLGSRFEFAAATIAIAWLVSLGVTIAMPRPPRLAWRPGRRPLRHPVAAPRPVSTRAVSGSRVRRRRADAEGPLVPQ